VFARRKVIELNATTKLIVEEARIIIKKFWFNELTWLEVNECVKEERVVLLPVGAIEQHGPHLPLDVDSVQAVEICERAAATEPFLFLIMPPVHYGWVGLGLDFPGTIHISAEHFIGYAADICGSLARMGFRKVILVNGHGGNQAFLEVAARRTMSAFDIHVALVNCWGLGKEIVDEYRESQFPGGMAHAGEYETSMYMACRPKLVKTNLIEKEMYESEPRRWFWGDLMASSPVQMMDVASRSTVSGVSGDPTKASAEKGDAFLQAAATDLIGVAREFLTIPIKARRSHLGSSE
jgi:creatinine amidohydrolase